MRSGRRLEEAAAAHEKTIADAKAKALALAQETHAKLNAETEAKRLALEAELNAKLAASEEQVLAMKAQPWVTSRRLPVKRRRQSFSTSPANPPTKVPLPRQSPRSRPDAGEFRCWMRSLL